MKQQLVIPRSKINPLAHWLRLPLRYLIASCLIPVGLLFGVCGFCHHTLRKFAPTQRDSTGKIPPCND